MSGKNWLEYSCPGLFQCFHADLPYRDISFKVVQIWKGLEIKGEPVTYEELFRAGRSPTFQDPGTPFYGLAGTWVLHSLIGLVFSFKTSLVGPNRTNTSQFMPKNPTISHPYPLPWPLFHVIKTLSRHRVTVFSLSHLLSFVTQLTIRTFHCSQFVLWCLC